MAMLTFALASVVAAVEGLSLDDIEYWAKGKHADELIEIVRKARRDGILDPASAGEATLKTALRARHGSFPWTRASGLLRAPAGLQNRSCEGGRTTMRTRSQLKFVGYWPDGSADESFTGTHRVAARLAWPYRRSRSWADSASSCGLDRTGRAHFRAAGIQSRAREAYDRETWRPDRSLSD